MFKVGDKVKCVDDTNANLGKLVKGQCYIVKSVSEQFIRIKGSDINWLATRFVSNSIPVSTKEFDAVNHPDHYKFGGIETIDFIEAKKLGYNLGNAVKYLSRAGKKDPNKHVEDLKKAVFYIQREINNLQKDK